MSNFLQGINLQQLGNSMGRALESFGAQTAKAAAKANGISAQAQAAQGAFNQASANQANMLNDQTLANQYAFNSAQMEAANQYNTQAWNQAAAWNQNMWEQQAAFNAEQAELNRQFNAAEAQKARDFNAAEAVKSRDWQEMMSNTAYQRAMKDMAAAGLNPILAYSQGGANIPGGAVATGGSASGVAATVGGAQMSSASSQMASGGLLGANSASEGNYTGQMEYMSGMLGLLSAAISGIASAAGAMGQMGDFGEGLGKGLQGILDNAFTYDPTKDVRTYIHNADKTIKEYSGKAKEATKNAWTKVKTADNAFKGIWYGLHPY